MVARKFLGSKDADWQAARPTAPYAPPTPPAPPPPRPRRSPLRTPRRPKRPTTLRVAPRPTRRTSKPTARPCLTSPPRVATPSRMPPPMPASRPPPEPRIAPEGEGSADEQIFAEGPTVEVPADDDPTVAIDASTGQPAAPDGSKYSGEGVYVGNEPPEGFTIKGNERSMKYHVPESSGYGRTDRRGLVQQRGGGPGGRLHPRPALASRHAQPLDLLPVDKRQAAGNLPDFRRPVAISGRFSGCR